MINVGLHHFRLVDTIVKEGTLTKAADTLFLTQSALSHQLKELENEVGVTIFHRKGKKLELSLEGKRFLCSAEKILTELKSLETDLHNFKTGDIGTLKVTTQCYTAYHWLPPIIKYYKKMSPGIDIHVVSAATHLPLEYLLKGDLDVAIVRNKIDNPQIHYEPIFQDKLFAIVSREHPLAKKKCITIKDLEGEELFLHFSNPATGNIPIVENLMQEQGVRPKHVHRIHYTDAIIEMVNANMGITVMADWIVQPYLESKDIVAKPMPKEVASRTWYAASCKQNIVVNNFLDCLKLHFDNIHIEVESGKKENVFSNSLIQQLMLNE
ncbi:LysR family transcriptional regulator [Pinibacter aurantiacus]|uniref:LysR family transcriptional regulator n=1 Tax=Pinibacter aurantiacus TaxID=2851599 RepID=A0A9E2SFH8_9BACT|nr:LysR family transcriptional regulator [Pinibacter aurantiacus]MBV4360125.1 LysR family transcriptional regulator [Pinibacter aurantiacus]